MRCALSFLGILVALVGCSKPETVVRIPVPAELKATPVAPTLAAPAHAEPAAEAQATDTKMAALPEELDPSIFSHVISQNGKIFVVLNYSPEESWGAGNPQLISDESPVVTRREIVDANLPGSLARRVGAPMHLFGAKGMVCHGKLGQLAMIGRVEPHFGERTRWQGGEEDENGIAQPPMTADEIAADAWQMSEMGIVLAAELIDVKGDCKSALFARSSALPAPGTFAARRAPSALATRAIEELHALERYAEIDAYYRESSAVVEGQAWEDIGSANTEVKLFQSRSGSYVYVSAYAGEPCSDFEGRLEALWKVEGQGKDARFSKIYEGAGSDEFAPTALVELDADGSPTLLGVESSLRKHPEGFGVRALHVPFLDCRC